MSIIKYINYEKLVGTSFEDLTIEEMKEKQGSADASIVSTPIITVSPVVTISPVSIVSPVSVVSTSVVAKNG